MRNIYRYRFSCTCPVDGDTVWYALEIESRGKILAEDIRRICDRPSAFHEDLANDLAALGGNQVLKAEHNGVHIETIRP